MFLGFFMMIFFGGIFLFILASFGVAMLESVDQVSFQQGTKLNEKLIRGESTASRKVAILSIDGVIFGSDDDFVVKQVKQVLKDKNIEAVVLRIDSPGGTITGSDYYHHLLKRIKSERDIPIVVSMGSMATSGGYYVAMAADEIFAERTTVTGSIGVIVPMYKGVELCKKIGIESTPITSGPLKTMGSFDKPLTEEQRAVWQHLVDDNFKRFKEVIREGRPEFEADPGKLDALATGQIYTATEAKENGLIDKIGFLDDAIDAAMEHAGLTEADSKVIQFRSKMKFADFLMESRGPDKLLRLETLLDLTTPRVYMICPDVLPLDP